MAVRTYSQLISDISNYLASASRITASEHRTLETNVVDTLFNSGNGSGARPYKVYTALLTQTGTDAPVATVLENTLGGTVVWTYSAVGAYTATLSGVFVVNKTTCILGTVSNPIIKFDGYRFDSNSIVATSFDLSTMSQIDEQLSNTSIEIRVYP